MIEYRVGPLLFGPISELYGRSRPLLIGCFCFCVMNIPVRLPWVPTITGTVQDDSHTIRPDASRRAAAHKAKAAVASPLSQRLLQSLKAVRLPGQAKNAG